MASKERRRPFNLGLIGEAEAYSSPPGRNWSGSLDKAGQDIGFFLQEFLLTDEQVRKDEMQMFVNRAEEDKFIAALHFPAVGGKARQVKIVAAIKQGIVEDTDTGVLRADATHALDEQALVDFEQICVNFLTIGLPILRKSAYWLSRLNPERLIEREMVTTDSAADGGEDYIVNRDKGWPVHRPRFNLFDVVRLEPSAATRAVDAGYLVPAKDVNDGVGGWGEEYRAAINAHRAALENPVARRPTPTRTLTFIDTSEGRKVRDRIVKAFAEIADRLFPASPGRALARTREEKAALIDELRDDFNRRRAAHVAKGESVTKDEVYEEMASKGKYGRSRETIGFATIKNLLGRNPQPTQRARSRRKRKRK